MLDEIESALGGQIGQCGDLQTFADSLFEHHFSAVRCRADVGPDSLPFPLKPLPWYRLGFSCLSNPDSKDQERPSRTLHYACGDFFLQDAGSMLALAACDADQPPKDRLVLDLCAAPGGKATALLESIGNGFLLANEPIHSRLPALAYNLARTGSNRYAISSLDPEELSERLGGVFDLVLVDAPCSGQALLGKGKQKTSSLSSKQIEHSAARARRILAAAMQLVRPGGQLVLSTCTFAEAENESQIRWMIQQNGVKACPVPRLREYTSDPISDCAYRLWPHRHHCAGSFAASLTVEHHDSESMESSSAESRERRRRNKKQKSLPPDELSQWYDNLPTRFVVNKSVIWGWPENVPDWVESIANRGPELAYRTGQTWKPSHHAAINRSTQWRVRQRIEVDESAAKQFLRGQPIQCQQRGWVTIVHQGRPLGWVKASGGTGKNHLPAAARMDL